MNTVLLNFKILLSNRKCAKWMEMFGCRMDCTCSVWYVLVVNVKKDACFGLSWPLCTIFKICSQFSEIAIFEKIVKVPGFFKNVSFLSDFQCGTPSCSHAHNKLVENLVNENTFLKKCVFYVFGPKNLTLPNNHFKFSIN